jgi:hypothetical protein
MTKLGVLIRVKTRVMHGKNRSRKEVMQTVR